ncbi:MAG: hypothetical protein JSS65_07785 [Armatimonadetes bacterium]|nr:hypothetical protein [Armatimonadota bacterium]
MSRALDLLQDLVALPGPPGQEDLVRDYLIEKVKAMGHQWSVDAKGNLHVPLGPDPKIVVTAHMDEIAMMLAGRTTTGFDVRPLGGLHPWKLGEGPVQILAEHGPVNGVLSMGSVHTESRESPITRAREKTVTWEDCHIFVDGVFHEDWDNGGGLYPGLRAVVHPSRRQLTPLGDFVGGHFLDDRADLVSWLLALEQLRDLPVLFLATTSEEVGGEGAQYALQHIQPDVCVALELGPEVPDARPYRSDGLTVWSNDSYAAISPQDLHLVKALDPTITPQTLSRGGSDASCAASRGLCARPITLGIPMENTHGYEIIHKDSMDKLADLTVRLVQALCG